MEVVKDGGKRRGALAFLPLPIVAFCCLYSLFIAVLTSPACAEEHQELLFAA